MQTKPRDRQVPNSASTEARRRSLWIINHYAVPPTKPGGTRHFDIARQLTDLGWDVTIIASGFRHKTREEESFTGRRW